MAYVRKRERWKPKKQVLLGSALLLFLIAIVIGESRRIPQNQNYPAVMGMIYREGLANLLPVSGFLEDREEHLLDAKLNQWLMYLVSPLYDYLMTTTDIAESEKIMYSEDMILIQEGNDEDYDAVMQIAMLEENGKDLVEPVTETMASHVESQITNENPGVVQAGGFIPNLEPIKVFDVEDLMNQQFLMENFYIVDPSTQIMEEQLDVDAMLQMDMRIDKNVEGPQILIYHTHSQEGFADSIPGDPSTTIVGAGEILAQILREEYGYSVLHHTGEYDVVRHDYAYSYAEPEIEKILKDNPSIQVVIDLHRDEVAANRKLVTQINGRDTAQIMFFNGLSYLNDIGSIDSLNNPNLEGNLAFSFRMQLVAEEYYPGLTRRIYLRGYRYNMHLASKYLLIELGAQTNTVEEIQNACDPLAHVLNLVIGENER